MVPTTIALFIISKCRKRTITNRRVCFRNDGYHHQGRGSVAALIPSPFRRVECEPVLATLHALIGPFKNG